MTSQQSEKRTFVQTVGEQVFSVMYKPGWPRWVLLAVAALIVILAACSFSGGSSYKEDPSALVPRSVQMYMETGDLDSLLRTAATWRLWKSDRRAKGDEQRNQLQVDLAGLIGEKVAGLGTRLPLLWLIDAKQAAYCVNKDDQGNESWALFLRTANSPQVMSDIGVEQGMNIETIKEEGKNGVYKLTGTGSGELYFGVLEPWLVISSQPTLPEFAIESSRRPAFSLSRSELLPAWRRGVVVRGLVNPVSQAGAPSSSAYGILSSWMDPDVRVNFTSRIGSKGLETTFDANQLSERVGRGGWWPLLAVLLAILGILALLVLVATILAMVGWGGWLKASAMRAGILPATAPEPVKPSAAFMEDSGAAKAAEAPAPAQIEPAPEPQITAPALDETETNKEEKIPSPNEDETKAGEEEVPNDANDTNDSK